MRYIIFMLFWYSQLLFAQETSIKVIEIEQLFEEFSDSCYLSQMIIDSERQLIFLGTNEGLFCFKGGEKAYHISKINNIGFSISSFLIANNKLWCGTANGFMFSLDLNTYPNFSTKQYATISNIKENKELKGQGILSMALHKTKLYAGTTEGIIISYEINDTANQINHTKIPNKNLANGNVYSMILHDEPPNIKNKKQNMLVGLADGLFYLQAQKWQAFPIYKPHITPTNNFEYYSKKTPFYISATYKLSQYQDKIWGIGKGNWSEQDNKHILFSLKNPYDKTKLDCDIYMPSSISKNSNMQFNDFQIDTQKNIWIATEDGLLIYNTTTQKEHYLTQETDSLFTIKQINNIFLENDTTAYLFGVSEKEKGLKVFKMSISKTMSEKEILTDKIENLETSTQITCNKVLKLKRLIFASSQDTYVDAVEAKKDINLLASYLRQNSYQQVVIEAHTSIVANEEKEHKITSKRLKRVKNDLIERGVAENQIITTAKGDSDLLIKKPINSKEHQKNRRVIAKISCY